MTFSSVTEALCRSFGQLNSIAHSCRFHPSRRIDRVSKELEARLFSTEDASSNRTAVQAKAPVERRKRLVSSRRCKQAAPVQLRKLATYMLKSPVSGPSDNSSFRVTSVILVRQSRAKRHMMSA